MICKICEFWFVDIWEFFINVEFFFWKYGLNEYKLVVVNIVFLV